MRKPLFDLDALHSFACGVELGSFARAAERLHRSTSAVSAQLKKLEEQAGAPILQKNGRGLTPTPAGETLLSYARRLLELNDEAVQAVRGAALSGGVRLGLAEDFGEGMLPHVLGRFARACPEVHVEVRVGRSLELQRALQAGQLDLALLWGDGSPWPHQDQLGQIPLHWIAPAGPPPQADGRSLPLVLFDAPCLVRRLACDALDQAGRPWRIAVSGSSLAGLWSAVRAGLGISARSALGLPADLQPLPPASAGLPPLPRLELALSRAQTPLPPQAEQLRRILLDSLEARVVQALDRPGVEANAANDDN
ncbi:LysR family transcriptional regulator [Chromobacterium phragmitis]|uniref:LysR substrate-binding domain-containing protein n=1 Tax=Chromobacterium amazonense TaxID=1382803 RepID=UPI0021B73849|nr:LysR substrate-binding domain-containing protein [Chromobacterium amazonense]MBM2884534.1 LysR family transcriptional regulator [Chromobacterium amazonense]MDE1716355.1 LysR substrate-binding domain-containing protein [Chromobacterium amazonense]